VKEIESYSTLLMQYLFDMNFKFLRPFLPLLRWHLQSFQHLAFEVGIKVACYLGIVPKYWPQNWTFSGSVTRLCPLTVMGNRHGRAPLPRESMFKVHDGQKMDQSE